MNKFFLCLLFLCLSVSASSLAQSHSPEQQVQSEERIQADIDYLASDKLAGRDSGTKGNRLAAKHIRNCFQQSGFQSPQALGETYFQPFGISGTEFTLGEQNQFRWDLGTPLSGSFRAEKDFTPCTFGSTGKVTGPIVFCGYGIDSPENHYNDFAGLDLEGKIALIVRRIPGQGNEPTYNPFLNSNGTLNGNYAALSSKLRNAIKYKAAGVIFVNDPYSLRNNALDSSEEIDQLMPLGYGGAPGRGKIPIIHATVASVDQFLIAAAGKTLATLTYEIDQLLKPKSMTVPGVVATISTDIQTEQLKTSNIIGELPGKGELAEETIVIGAHMDHVGMGAYGSLSGGPQAIHNGADDNASGTAALMELSRRLSQIDFSQMASHRRIVLIAFSAEERGLLGSKHYVSDAVFPLENTVAMLNMDMVGWVSDSKVTVFGFGGSSYWTPWFDENTKRMQLNISRKKLSLGPSDHAPFFEKGIPILHFFSGLHGNYHRPTDDSNLVNSQGIRRVVDILEKLTVDLSQEPERPSYVKSNTWINIMSYAIGAPHLGLIPDLHAPTQMGVIVKGTQSDSPLQQSGVEAGDRITHWNGKPLASLDDLHEQLNASKTGQVITLTVVSDDKSQQVNVTLAAPR